MKELHRDPGDVEESVPWNLPRAGQRCGLGADSVWPFVAGTLRAQRPDDDAQDAENAGDADDLEAEHGDT
jgi:hypothetical protein